MLWYAGVLLAPLISAGAAIQQPPSAPPRPNAQIAAMDKLGYMAGTWQGEGWMDMGGRRATFRGSEVVQRKLDGTVLLVEGAFFAKIPGVEQEVPVHTTLGVISFDPRTQKYRFTTWLATGASGERELQVEPGGWEWRIDNPKGVVRYRMTLAENGEWLEVGERSVDGQAWEQFFEMRLKK
jgi:hypothetical protein